MTNKNDYYCIKSNKLLNRQLTKAVDKGDARGAFELLQGFVESGEKLLFQTNLFGNPNFYNYEFNEFRKYLVANLNDFNENFKEILFSAIPYGNANYLNHLMDNLDIHNLFLEKFQLLFKISTIFDNHEIQDFIKVEINEFFTDIPESDVSQIGINLAGLVYGEG